jgi:RNA recognition motif-containing protein
MQGSSSSPSATSAPPSHSIDTPVQPQQSAIVPLAQQNNAHMPMQLPAPTMQMPVPIRPAPVAAGAGGSVYYQQQVQPQHPLHPQQQLHPQQLMHFPYAVSAVSTTTPSPVLTPPVNTLWIGDLPLEVDENFLLAVFGAVAAEIAGIKIIRHKDSRASLGYGFVEFRTHETAEIVLRAFDGQPLLNYPGKHLRMNWSLSGSSSSSSSVASFSSVGSGHAASAATIPASSAPSGSNATGSAASAPAAAAVRAPTFSVWVGDLDHAVTDAALEAAFRSSFASTIGARIALDAATGRSRGYGFVKLADEDEAKASVAKMNGFMLLARPMRVSIANTNAKYTASSARHTHAPVFQSQQSPPSHHHHQSAAASGEGAVSSGPIVFSPAGSSSYVQLQQHQRQHQQQQQTAYAPQWVQAPLMHQLPPSATAHGNAMAPAPVVIGASVGSPAAGAGSAASPAAENESAQGTTAGNTNADGNSSNTTIFVGGLESHLSADYVHALFAPFGPLLSVKVPQGKNCGFVQFSLRADAEAALVALQSYDTGASACDVCLLSSKMSCFLSRFFLTLFPRAFLSLPVSRLQARRVFVLTGVDLPRNLAAATLCNRTRTPFTLTVTLRRCLLWVRCPIIRTNCSSYNSSSNRCCTRLPCRAMVLPTSWADHTPRMRLL